MGERGPIPAPTALKIAQGTYRSSRAVAHEAQPTGRPSCPAWLPADGKKEFRRVVKLLSELGLIGRSDGNAIGRYCQTWVRWRKAIAALEKFGEVQVFHPARNKTKGKTKTSGKPKTSRVMQVSPYASLARALALELSRLEQQLGLNPSARSRINVAAADLPDELDF